MIADSEGRAPLHWAVDRGHLNVTELLVNRNADVNAKVFICCNKRYNLSTKPYLSYLCALVALPLTLSLWNENMTEPILNVKLSIIPYCNSCIISKFSIYFRRPFSAF